jgi:hypothetical protein
MNRKRKIEAEFGPETRFELRPELAGSGNYRDEIESRFESLKRALLEAKLSELWETGTGKLSQLRRAANEAASLAWITPYPLLVFPELFSEKADRVLAIADRQDMIREHTRELLCV